MFIHSYLTANTVPNFIDDDFFSRIFEDGVLLLAFRLQI